MKIYNISNVSNIQSMQCIILLLTFITTELEHNSTPNLEDQLFPSISMIAYIEMIPKAKEKMDE